MDDAERPELRIDHAGARPVVTKLARSATARARLDRELAALRRAQHPGTIVLDEVNEEHGRLSVRTRFVGGRTLASLGRPPVERIAGIMVSLATTVADLHEMGIAHRRLTAEHVLIASDGRPVVCGFGDAVIEGDAEDRSGDVQALGELLRDLVTPFDDVAPIPPARIGRRGTWSGYQRRALLNLADQAVASGPASRLSAVQFAENLRRVVPDATLTEARPEAGADPPDDGLSGQAGGAATPTHRRGTARLLDRVPPISRRLVVTGSSVFGTALLLLLAVTILPGRGDATLSDASTGPPTTAATTNDTASSPPREVAGDAPDPGHPPSQQGSADADPSDSALPPIVGSDEPAAARAAIGCGAGPDSAAADAAGHPCPVELALAGRSLTIDEERFDLGLDNPGIALGDFACAGAVQLAVLDLDTGEVFVFDRWADDQPATAPVLDQVPSGRRLIAEPRGTGTCHRLVALDAFGIRHQLDTHNARDGIR